MCFVKRDQLLPKNEAAYRLCADAPVAQLDRVRGYEPRGREFESLRARQLIEDDAVIRAGCVNRSSAVVLSGAVVLSRRGAPVVLRR